MKKVFSILIVAVALVAVSCAGNANQPAEQTETAVEVVAAVDTTATAACCADSTCCEEGKECAGTNAACADKKVQ